MTHVFVFLFCFIISYLVYRLVIIQRKKGFEKFKESKQLQYFKTVYNINFDKINIKKFANSLALTNAFIIGLTVTIMDFIPNFILKILVAFIVLLPLMLISYKLLGQAYKKKEGK